MQPIPVLFTHQQKYGQRIVFGLIEVGRTFTISPIRCIRTAEDAVPDGLDIIAINDDCHRILIKLGLLEPLLQSMAEDIAHAIERQLMTSPKYAKQVAKLYRNDPLGAAEAGFIKPALPANVRPLDGTL